MKFHIHQHIIPWLVYFAFRLQTNDSPRASFQAVAMQLLKFVAEFNDLFHTCINKDNLTGKHAIICLKSNKQDESTLTVSNLVSRQNQRKAEYNICIYKLQACSS